MSDILLTYNSKNKLGIKYVDKDTFGHFCGGVLSCLLLQYSNVPVAYNFILANGVHYMIERTEKSVAPNGRVLETIENHIGDIIAFFVGWVVTHGSREFVVSATVQFVELLFRTVLLRCHRRLLDRQVSVAIPIRC